MNLRKNETYLRLTVFLFLLTLRNAHVAETPAWEKALQTSVDYMTGSTASLLRPLLTLLNQEGVTEISINRPQEVWTKFKGEMTCKTVVELDFKHLESISKLMAKHTEQKISSETPLLSVTIPEGYHIQIAFLRR